MFALDKRDFCTLLHDSTILCIVTFLEYELDQFSKRFCTKCSRSDSYNFQCTSMCGMQEGCLTTCVSYHIWREHATFRWHDDVQEEPT